MKLIFKTHFTVLIFLSLFLYQDFLVAQNTRLWATYYGGVGTEGGASVVRDAAGNLYMTGTANSTLNIASGGFQNTFGGGSTDAFLVKFDPAGNRLWATYYGGTGDENDNNVAIDAFGNVYLTGYTNSTANISSGGFQNTFGGGGWDAYLVKFDAVNGNRLWATYYGGTGTDVGSRAVADASGNLYLSGYTDSPTAISSAGFQNTYGGGADDAFLVKFDAATGNRIWATYYGGFGIDDGSCVTADASGNIYLAGSTTSGTNISSGGFQNAFGGVYDAFLVKFNSAGNRLWATYYGGTGVEGRASTTTDAFGNVFLSGYTHSTTAISSGGFQNTFGGGNDDAYLVKFDAATGNRLWATYYGGLDTDQGYSVATDPAGNVYLAGYTSSTNGIASGGFQNTYGGGTVNSFLVKFTSSGNRLCATYYGGTIGDSGWSIATDASGNVYLAGYARSLSAIASGGFQNTFGGGVTDAFLVKFTSCSILSATATSTNILCNGQCTGTSATTPSGGSPPYSYSWSPSGGTNSAATGLCAGNYSITVTDASLSTVTATVSITQPAVLTASVSSTNPGCNGATGSANVTTAGGTPSYTYAWSPGGGTASSVTGLSSGNYSVIIADANGCAATQTLSITQPAALTVSVSTNTASCLNSNGNATATPSGGTSGYSYLWSNGQTTQTATGLPAGTYTVTITDAGGCTQTALANISNTGTPQASISPVTNVSCNGGNNGSAIVNVTLGSPPYTYVWNPSGQTSSAVTGLSAGNHQVTVTDSLGCIVIVSTIIIEPSVLTSSIASATISCSGVLATATVTAGGGTPGYTYLWSPGGGTASVTTGFASGNYTAMVTDANGCTKTSTISITQSALLTVSVTTTTASCLSSNGSATANASGGSPGYTYLWSNAQTNPTATGLSAGTYSVIITDAAGCTQTALANISNTGSPQANIGSVTHVSCNGGSNGSATVNVTVGTPSFMYSWNPGGQSTSAISGLSAGNYVVTVTDALGCIVIVPTTITEPALLTSSVTAANSLCNGTTGTATVIATGGTPAYSYYWSQGAQTTQTASGLSLGMYTVTVTDAGGCTSSSMIVISSGTGPSVNISSNISISPGASANLIASGGNMYAWSPSAGLSCTNCSNPVATPGQTTQYCVVVTDTNGCSDSACVTVYIIPELSPCGEFYLPNAFSPNNDNENDVFKAYTDPVCVKEFKLIIYNRWGQKVSETDDITQGWNGELNGGISNSAAYAYYCRAVFISGEEIVRKGNVTLLR